MKKHYRSDIDGLRGLCVLAVVFYHSNLKIYNIDLFSGGYLGVDIFFVISGYIITYLLINEYQDTGKINLVYFYNRRIRRLLPSLIFVILFSTTFSFIFFYPFDFLEYIKSSIFSLFFISNHFFAFSTEQYSAINSQLNPLLHTWSLSIEEQFYIFFPIIFLILFRNINTLISIIFFIVLISLFFCYFFKFENNNSNFYFAISRIWEILCGSFSALITVKYKKIKISQNLKLILLFFIILCFFIFDDKEEMPNIFLILPVLASSILVLPNHSNNKLFNFFLSNKLIIFFGLISYSLYLWHFPIFAFSRYLEIFNGNIYIKLLVALIVILISVFSYFFVERPSRNLKIISNNFFYSILASFIFLFLIFFYISIKTNGFLNLNNNFIIQNFEKPQWNVTKQNNKKCFLRSRNFCKFDIGNNNKKIILLGDSHAASFQDTLKKNLKNTQLFLATGEPFYLNTDRVNIKNKTIDNNFYLVNKNRQELINKNPNSILIISQRFQVHLNQSFFEKSDEKIVNIKTNHIYKSRSNDSSLNFFDKFIDDLNSLSINHKIILVNPIPEVGFDVKKKLFFELPKNNSKSLELLQKNNYLFTTLSNDYYLRNKTYFNKIKKLNKNIYIIEINKYFCDNFIDNQCITHNDKKIFYNDNNHLSSSGSEILIDLIKEYIQ